MRGLGPCEDSRHSRHPLKGVARVLATSPYEDPFATPSKECPSMGLGECLSRDSRRRRRRMHALGTPWRRASRSQSGLWHARAADGCVGSDSRHPRSGRSRRLRASGFSRTPARSRETHPDSGHGRLARRVGRWLDCGLFAIVCAAREPIAVGLGRRGRYRPVAVGCAWVWCRRRSTTVCSTPKRASSLPLVVQPEAPRQGKGSQ